MTDLLPQSYFPSCRARFILRFEDWNSPDAPPPPAKPPQLRTGKKDEAPLEVKREGDRLLILPKGTTAQAPGGPQGQLDPPDDRTHVVEGVFPISCEVRRNGIREAAECSITLPLADFPFDPRAIRSCAVQVYMGTVTVPAPEQSSSQTVSAPDWKVLFSDAGLDLSQWKPVNPQLMPRSFAETRAAWEGRFPSIPSVLVRIEAAALEGKPVSFEISGPWRRPNLMDTSHPEMRGGSRPPNLMDISQPELRGGLVRAMAFIWLFLSLFQASFLRERT